MKNSIRVSPILTISSSATRQQPAISAMQVARAILLMMMTCSFLSAVAQDAASVPTTAPNQWTWVGGSNKMSCAQESSGTLCEPSVAYGTYATPAPGNTPGSRSGASTWRDSQGNLWLYGGVGSYANGSRASFSDLWKFDTSLREWGWVGGSNKTTCNGGALCGNQTTLDNPGSRFNAQSWTDATGNFWLFSGDNFDEFNQSSGPNDLWKFSPSTKAWKLMGGSSGDPSKPGNFGVYGTLGKFAPGNIPGYRLGASTWTDKNGNLWLFGGLGKAAPVPNTTSMTNTGYLNDLWQFNAATNEWAWMGGRKAIPIHCRKSECDAGATGVYGTLGASAIQNMPGARESALSWTDPQGNLWLFGGTGFTSETFLNNLNDLWKFDLSTLEWTWMSGSSTIDRNGGVFGELGTPAAGNTPGYRGLLSQNGASWTDQEGNLWLFGGTGAAANLLSGSFSSAGFLNDLWEFTPSTSQWTWMSGNNRADVPGVYGRLGHPTFLTMPGARNDSVGWTDRDGNLWLFGGYYYAYGFDDLWEYSPSVPLPQADSPVLSVATGTYRSTQTVTIQDVTPGAKIYYTVDGSVPTSASTLYTSPLNVPKTITVSAIAEARGYAESALVSATYTILKPQVIYLSQPVSPIVYGIKPFSITVRASSGLPVTLTLLSGPAQISGQELIVTSTGIIVIRASQAGNSIYAAAPPVSASVVVAKANLTATATSLAKVYRAGVPVLTYTYSGFVNGDTAAKAVRGLPLRTTSATSNSPVGSYPIQITPGTLTSSNYNLLFVPGELTVTKAPLQIVATNLSIKLGKTIPPLTFTAKGFYYGDSLATAVTGVPHLSTTANSVSGVGNYPIVVSLGTLHASNYAFTFTNGTLTIVP